MSLRRSVGLGVLLASLAVIGCGNSERPSASATSTTGAAAVTAAKPPFGFLNTPAEAEVVQLDPSKPWYGTGWALAGSGVADVSVKFDDGQTAYVKTGFRFPGVRDQNPGFADADQAGYMFAMPSMKPGPHSLVLTVRAKDGSSTQIERHFSIR